MAVVVNDQLVADALGLDARALGAKRAAADRDLEKAVGGGLNGWEWFHRGKSQGKVALTPGGRHLVRYWTASP